MGKQHDMADYLNSFSTWYDTTGVPVEMNVHGGPSRRDQMMVDSYDPSSTLCKEHQSLSTCLRPILRQLQTCDNQMPQDHSKSYDPFLADAGVAGGR